MAKPRFTYRQYGTFAVILADNVPVAAARETRGFWTLTPTARVPAGNLMTKSLDEMMERINAL